MFSQCSRCLSRSKAKRLFSTWWFPSVHLVYINIICIWLSTLPETNSSHLKISGWKTLFGIRTACFQAVGQFREMIFFCDFHADTEFSLNFPGQHNQLWGPQTSLAFFSLEATHGFSGSNWWMKNDQVVRERTRTMKPWLINTGSDYLDLLVWVWKKNISSDGFTVNIKSTLNKSLIQIYIYNGVNTNFHRNWRRFQSSPAPKIKYIYIYNESLGINWLFHLGNFLVIS